MFLITENFFNKAVKLIFLMLKIVENPVLQHLLLKLRDKNTSTSDFRRLLRIAGYFLTYEILNQELKILLNIEVETPLNVKAKGYNIEAKILQEIIMRAGQPFAEGGSQLLDSLNIYRQIGVIDAKRVENSGKGLDFEIEISSFKTPNPKDFDLIIIYDPMLATGNTLEKSIKLIKNSCDKELNIIACTLIAAPYGVEKIQRLAKIYTLALDKGVESIETFKGLNSKGFIVPGLGDCGDRAFGKYE